MRICVIGAGYVGLVTSAVFADMGNHVTCLDIDPGKIAALTAGQAPFYEPGLQQMIQRNGDAGRLSFTTDYDRAVPGCEMVFIAVGTPPGPDGGADLTHLETAVAQAAQHLSDGALIVWEHASGSEADWPDWVTSLSDRRYGSTTVSIGEAGRAAAG